MKEMPLMAAPAPQILITYTISDNSRAAAGIHLILLVWCIIITVNTTLHYKRML
jgi:hypothetical protein